MIWILHLFSGRRRKGDCHFWSECCVGILQDIEVRVLSVDTAIDVHAGNLDDGPIFEQLISIIRKKYFAAGLTGPPCETFSAARHIELPDGNHPRPLRSAALPWVLPHRTAKELRQTSVGSRLMLHSFLAEFKLVLAGAGSLMEHPTEHSAPERASVWRLAAHEQWMMRLPHAFQHHVEQWKFGGVGVKPTTLRAVNLADPAIIARVFENHIDHLALRPSCSLSGRGTDGQYRTAAAKEYPSQLCRALIVAVLNGIKARLLSSGSCSPKPLCKAEQAWIDSLFLSASTASLSGKFLPDFQG